MKEIKHLVKILTIENEYDMCTFEFEMNSTKYRFIVSPDSFDLSIVDYMNHSECSCEDGGRIIEVEDIPIATICAHENSLLQGNIHSEWREK